MKYRTSFVVLQTGNYTSNGSVIPKTTHLPITILSESTSIDGTRPRRSNNFLLFSIWVLILSSIGLAENLTETDYDLTIKTLTEINEKDTENNLRHETKLLNCTYEEVSSDDFTWCPEANLLDGNEYVTKDGHSLRAVAIQENNNFVSVTQIPNASRLYKRWNIDNVPLGTWFHHWYTKRGNDYWTDWRVQSCSLRLSCGTSYSRTITSTDKLAYTFNSQMNWNVAKAFAASVGFSITKERTMTRSWTLNLGGCDGYQFWGKEHWFYQRQNVRWMVKRCYGGSSCLHSGDGEGFDHDVWTPIDQETSWWIRNSGDHIDDNQCGRRVVNWL